MSSSGPERVKTRTAGRQFMNFSRFSAFSAITGPAERKNSRQMRRFQTISEFSHGLDPYRKLVAVDREGGSCPKRHWKPGPQPRGCGLLVASMAVDGSLYPARFSTRAVSASLSG